MSKHTPITPESPDLDAVEWGDAPSTLKDSAAFDRIHLRTPYSHLFSSRSVTFDQSKLTNTALTASTLPSTRWTDCIIQAADLSGATWIDARLIRVQITNTKLTGFDARGSTLRDVHFKECKAPDMLLSESTFDRVRFDQCQLTKLDLAGAQIKSLAINNSDARSLLLSGAKIDHLDLRDSLIEDIVISQSQLNHITISRAQAPALAQALGVRITDS
ncbi:MAG: pentapeptide repeat-containing protein [Phycisphaerales bacterium]